MLFCAREVGSGRCEQRVAHDMRTHALPPWHEQCAFCGRPVCSTFGVRYGILIDEDGKITPLDKFGRPDANAGRAHRTTSSPKREP